MNKNGKIKADRKFWVGRRGLKTWVFTVGWSGGSLLGTHDVSVCSSFLLGQLDSPVNTLPVSCLEGKSFLGAMQIRKLGGLSA